MAGDRWIDLRAGRRVMPAGVETAPCYVLDRPDWVHAAAVFPGLAAAGVLQPSDGAEAV